MFQEKLGKNILKYEFHASTKPLQKGVPANKLGHKKTVYTWSTVQWPPYPGPYPKVTSNHPPFCGPVLLAQDRRATMIHPKRFFQCWYACSCAFSISRLQQPAKPFLIFFVGKIISEVGAIRQQTDDGWGKKSKCLSTTSGFLLNHFLPSKTFQSSPFKAPWVKKTMEIQPFEWRKRTRSGDRSTVQHGLVDMMGRVERKNVISTSAWYNWKSSRPNKEWSWLDGPGSM